MPRRTWDDICAEVGFCADDVPTLTCKDLHLVRSGQLTVDDVRRQKGANMATKKNAATTATTKENTVQPTLIDVPVTAPTTATTKPEAKKATTKKENTVEKTAKPKRTVADVKASYDHTIAVVREMYGDAMPIDDPVNPITGRPLNRDAAQRDNLRYLAADLGWTSNEFATVKQVESYGGKVKDGAYKPIQFMPGRFYRVVNLEDVEWPNDVRPEFTPENKVEKPKDDKPKATTNKTTTKPDPKLKKLEEELAAQKKANDEMRELLAAQKASTDQMTAMFTALMAKLG